VSIDPAHRSDQGRPAPRARTKSKYTYYRCIAFHGRCGYAYIREERLAQRLGVVVDKMQLPERVANAITARLHASEAELEQARSRSSVRLLQRQRALQAKIDRRIRRLRRGPDLGCAMDTEVGAMGNEARDRERRTQCARLAGDDVRRNG
jgi:hypothetical protein